MQLFYENKFFTLASETQKTVQWQLKHKFERYTVKATHRCADRNCPMRVTTWRPRIGGPDFNAVPSKRRKNREHSNGK